MQKQRTQVQKELNITLKRIEDKENETIKYHIRIRSIQS